jgi:hypothetical protein
VKERVTTAIKRISRVCLVYRQERFALPLGTSNKKLAKPGEPFWLSHGSKVKSLLTQALR